MTATISGGSCSVPSLQITKTLIRVGPPPAAVFPDITPCPGDPITLCVDPVFSASSRQWVARVGNSNVTLTESSDWCVDVPDGTLYVDLSTTNICGTTTTRKRIEYANCLMANVAPNPADNTTSVTLEQQNIKKQVDIKAVKVTSSTGVEMRQWTFGAGTKKAVLDLGMLPAGIYTVSVTADGKTWQSTQLKKQ